jgi:hypothetical protein
MIAHALARPRAARRQPAPSVRLCRNASGNWTLSGANPTRSEFTDFNAALRSARTLPEAKDAPIEVWQGGEYICCLPSDEGPRRGPPYTEDIAGLHAPRFSAAERQANRLAQILLPVAGVLFWLALLGLAFAASFGWRVALH